MPIPGSSINSTQVPKPALFAAGNAPKGAFFFANGKAVKHMV